MNTLTESSLLDARVDELQATLFAQALSTGVVSHVQDGGDRLKAICRFVDAVTSGAITPITTGVTPKGTKIYVGLKEARRYFRHLPSMVRIADALPDCYSYGEVIQLFQAARQRVTDLDQYLDAGDLWSMSLGPMQSAGFDQLVATFNRMVTEIASLYHEGGFKARIAKQQSSLADRRDNYDTFIDDIFKACSRVLVLRIDFEYQKEFVDQVDLQRLSDDLTRLQNNWRHNAMFDGMLTHFFLLEYGADRGPHCHAVFFFDGSKRLPSSHIHLAKLIGDYWKTVVTRGIGAYFNCNAMADEYERRGHRGIGLIHRYDIDIIKNLKERVFGYFVKGDQIAQPIVAPGFRRFRPGQVPERGPGGRPRTLLTEVIEAVEAMQADEAYTAALPEPEETP